MKFKILLSESDCKKMDKFVYMSKIKKARNILHYFYPLFLGVFMFNVLRVVTDFTKKDNFYEGNLSRHFVSLLIVIVLCYVFDIRWRRRLQNKSYLEKINKSVAKEYGIVFFSMFISLNVILFIGESANIIVMGDGIIDCMLINVVFIPILLIYYSILRNEKMNKDNVEKTVLLEQIKTKQLETELDYLKAQYHPHFLFNALNTVYFQMDEDKDAAKHTVELLSELLRYQLYSIHKVVTIEEEIDFILRYIEFQKLRMSKKLQVEIHIDPQLKEQAIQPLLFQPLLENAFKYVDYELQIHICFQLINNQIHFTVENSFTEYNNTCKNAKSKGIGIENLKRRLELLYPEKYLLNIEKKSNIFRVQLNIEI